MDFARKMILVPRESVERIQLQQTGQQGELSSVQTPGTTLSRLDAEMSEILNSRQKLSDEEKWSKFQRVLKRFLHFKEKTVRENNNEEKNESESWLHADQCKEDDKEGVELQKSSDEYIVENVPLTFRKRAKNILQILRTNNRFKWDANGVLSIDGGPIR